MARTDPEKARAAMERANRESTKEYDLIGWLCPACHEPAIPVDPNPSEYVHDPDEGEFGVDRKAYQHSPAALLRETDETVIDRVCVYPETVEYDDGEHLRVTAYKHNFSSDRYQAWAEQLEALQEVERRKEENAGLDAFTADSGGEGA